MKMSDSLSNMKAAIKIQGSLKHSQSKRIRYYILYIVANRVLKWQTHTLLIRKCAKNSFKLLTTNMCSGKSRLNKLCHIKSLTIERTFKNSWVSNCNRILKRGYDCSPKIGTKKNNVRSTLITLYHDQTKVWLTFKPVFSVLSRDAVEHLKNRLK